MKRKPDDQLIKERLEIREEIRRVRELLQLADKLGGPFESPRVVRAQTLKLRVAARRLQALFHSVILGKGRQT